MFQNVHLYPKKTVLIKGDHIYLVMFHYERYEQLMWEYLSVVASIEINKLVKAYCRLMQCQEQTTLKGACQPLPYASQRSSHLM